MRAGRALMIGASGGMIPEQIGNVFTNDFTSLSNLNDFTVVTTGSNTISLTGGYLRSVQTSGTGTFQNYISYNTYGSTNLENYSIEALIYPRTLTSTSYGVSLGVMRTQSISSVIPYVGFLQMDSSSAKGTVYICRGEGSSISFAATGATKLIYNLGDPIVINETRDKLTYSFTAQNLHPSRLNTVSVSLTATTAYASGIGSTPNNIGKPTLIFSGGTQDVEYFKYSSTSYKNTVCFIGESTTLPFGVNSISNRLSNLVMSTSTKPYTVCASASSKTQDLLLCSNEITLLNPTYLILNTGINDQYTGVSVSTTMANIQSLTALCPNAKIALNYIYPFTTNNPNSYNAALSALGYSAVADLTTVYGTGTPKLPNPTMYNSDLIHPSQYTSAAAEYLSKFPDII